MQLLPFCAVGLDPQQRRTARIFAQELRRSGASPRVQKAAYAAALVESNLRPLNYGDRDSLGVLQQRPSMGWGTPEQVRDPRYAIREFLKRAIPLNEGFKGSAGQLAQAVQRSAFPERYDQRGAEADALRAKFVRSYVDAPDGTVPARRTPGTAVSAPMNVADLLRGSAAPQVQASAPAAPAFAARAVSPAGAQLPQGSRVGRGPRVEDLLAGVSRTSGQPAASASGGPNGGQAAPGSSRGAYKPRGRLLELFHDPGINIDNGKRTGAIGGHDKHVHAAFSNAQDRAWAERLAKRMGLPVTSEGGGKHTEGSFHYQRLKGGESAALDVGGDPRKLLIYNRRIARRFR